MKPVDVESNSYAEYNVDSNVKGPKFKKIKNIFAKWQALSWSEEFSVINKIKNAFPWPHVIIDLNGEEIIGTFYEIEIQKTNQKEFRIEKVIKRKGNKQYGKCQGYDNSSNCWIDKKTLHKNKSILNHIVILEILKLSQICPVMK